MEFAQIIKLVGIPGSIQLIYSYLLLTSGKYFRELQLMNSRRMNSWQNILWKCIVGFKYIHRKASNRWAYYGIWPNNYACWACIDFSVICCGSLNWAKRRPNTTCWYHRHWRLLYATEKKQNYVIMLASEIGKVTSEIGRWTDQHPSVSHLRLTQWKKFETE